MKNKHERALYNRLLEEGTPKDEIEALYRKLRSKGYGDAASPQAAEQPGRRNREAHPAGAPTPEAGSTAVAHTATARPGSAAAERPTPPMPHISPALRRRINRWAFQHRLLITGFAQRWHDMLSLFRPNEPDRANARLIRALSAPHRVTAQVRAELSLVDTLKGLRQSARLFLGELLASGHDAVLQAYRRRDPFALEYLSRFSREQKRLLASLARLDQAWLDGIPVAVADLGRPARELYRLVITTEQVSKRRAAEALAIGKDIVMAYGRPASAEQLDDARDLFIHCLDQLPRFKREFYPVVLKAIGRFYEEYDESQPKHDAIFGFLGITEDDILSHRHFVERETRLREQRLIEEKQRELDNLELEKEAGFSRRFQGALSVLSTLFPGSGIENIEQNRYLLPYFDTRVFAHSLSFDHQRDSIETVAADDPMQPLLVLHRIIDNLLASIDRKNMEELLMRENTADALANINARWREIYTALFDPYVRALNSYARGIEEGDRYGRSFADSVLARSLRDEIAGYRAAAIRDGVAATEDGFEYSGPKLHVVVEEFHDLLAELGQDLSQDLVRRQDPIGKRIYAQLTRRPFVDFRVHAAVQSPRLKPVTRQVKRYVEAKYYSSVSEIPKLAQLFLFDVLRGVVDIYHFLVNDEESFLRHRGTEITVAGEHERAAWARERTERSRDSVELLRVRLAESEATSYVDELTGLKNKNYFLKELPRQFADLKKQQRPFCFLLLDLDHFKWVNDELGHQKGDEVLTQTAAALLDGIRLGHDVGIRYGGEEMLLLVQAPLHNAVLLAERLRHAQQERVATLEPWAAIRELADNHGEPCTTLSIGLVRADGLADVDSAIGLADKALYKAKEERNCVVLCEDGPQTPTAEPSLLSYAEYAQKLRREAT